MIFYLALVNGRRQLATTQVEAKKLSKDYQQIDIPTDKPGLQAAIQELLTEADNANSHTMNMDVAGIPVTATETEDGVTLDLAEEPVPWREDNEHSSRCIKCHRLLSATENGAHLLATGEDMTIIQEMIENSPEWFRTGLEQAIAARRANDIDQVDPEQNIASET